MGKYDALRVYLASHSDDEVRLTFGQLQDLVGRLSGMHKHLPGKPELLRFDA